MFSPWRFFLSGACSLLVLALCGCSGGDGKADVTGTVKFDGTALQTGHIKFSPADGKAEVTGGEIKEGRYKVRVPLGAMKVEISMPKVVGTKKLYAASDSPSMAVTAEGLPDKYNKATTLQLEVKAPATEKDFDLTSK